MGRKTLILGRPMLDSIAKGDLLKVLTRVQADNLLPGAVDKFQKVLDTVNALDDELNSLKQARLEGDASAKFAALQAQVMPLIDDIRALVAGDGRLFAGLADGQIWESADRGDTWQICATEGDSIGALHALAFTNA